MRIIISSYKTIDSIIGLGLKSDYKWSGEDLIEALRKWAEEDILL